jgi:uncharacterized protein YcbK (DUF882 family)
MGDLSPHFSRTEFRCKGTGKPGHPAHDTVVSSHLVQHLEKLRSIVGRPLPIVSGYRCRWWNAKVGGAPAGQHPLGTAADIPAGYATVRQAEQAGFTGIGNRGQWAVHVDVRPRRARWTY